MTIIKLLPFISKVDHSLSWIRILQFGICIRLLLFATVFFLPIPYGPSPPISPLHYQTGVDLSEYLENISFYLSYSGLMDLFHIFKDLLIDQNYSERRSLGPVYPFFLAIMDYRPDNTVPLSTLIFIMEASCFSLWCFIAKEKISGIFGIVFALMPHTLWFSILISSDIFAYFLATLFFLVIHARKNVPGLIPLLCLLLVLTKPTGIVFCVGALFLSRNFFANKVKFYSYKIFILLITLFAFVFYIPYFLVDQVIIDNSVQLTEISRHGFSVLNLFQKFFHILGFHRSESNILIAEIVRAIFGVLFFIGLIKIFIFEKWLRVPLGTLLAFLLFLHVPSWRYVLPFLPILLINGLSILNNMKAIVMTHQARNI